MPKFYGTALYGRGNYSAATGMVLAVAQGSVVETGSVALPTWHSRLAAAPGPQGVAGQGAALSWQPIISGAGLYGLAGDAAFGKSNIWGGAPDSAGSWMHSSPGDNSWIPAEPALQNWSET